MRREHDSIVVDVLDALDTYRQQSPGVFRVTELAARANLPHDRLKTYLVELATMGLLDGTETPMPTSKGRQFLECYHAWVRIQRLYGLRPRGIDAGAVRTVPATAAP